MNSKIVFTRKPCDYSYKILPLSNRYNYYYGSENDFLKGDSVLNVIGLIFMHGSGTVREQLLDAACTKVNGGAFYIHKREGDHILISNVYKNCEEEGCCGPIEEVEFSQSKLLELLDRWDAITALAPERIEFSRSGDEFELKVASHEEIK